MADLIINKLNELPDQLSFQWDANEASDDTVNYQGKKYQYIGSYEQDYSFIGRMWLAITSIVQGLLSVIGFASIDFQENWQIIFTGKQVIKVYCNPDELEETDAKIHALGKEKLSPFPKKEEKPVEVPNKPILEGKPISEDLSKPVSEIDLGKKENASADFSALEKVIAALNKGPISRKKKGALFQKGLDLFKEKGYPTEVETFRLANQDQFKIGNKQSKTGLPAYFSEKFEDGHSLNLEATPSYYDYEPTDANAEDFWVDFANASLGGGCFGGGFVQEEIMVAEMPEFANHIANHLSPVKEGWCDIATREGDLKDRNRVMKGSPTPYLLKGLRRVQVVNNNLAYGSKFEGLSKQNLLDSTKSLDVPQKLNLLAIAAPKLFTQERAEQWHSATLADIFNTLMAGFSLVQEQSENPVIHSGRIGCGVFNNDIHAVYLLHCLTAQQLGVKVVLHGYSSKEAKQFQDSWDKVAPQLTGKTLEESMSIISAHLTKNY